MTLKLSRGEICVAKNGASLGIRYETGEIQL